MATTPNYALPFPDEYEPADVPLDLEALARRIDQLGAMFFPGDLKLSAAQVAPAGWLICDGREVERAVFAALFEAIGTTHGAGDGSLTFNLPAFRGRVPLGAGTGAGLTDRPLGQRGGVEAHVLSVAEMAHHGHGVSDPSHAHQVADPGHLHWPASGGPFFAGVGGPWNFSGNDIPANHGGSTGHNGVGVGIYGAFTGISILGEGGNAGHPNMQPWVAVNVFIKT
jgi:microcystin-dependent protein